MDVHSKTSIGMDSRQLLESEDWHYGVGLPGSASMAGGGLTPLTLRFLFLTDSETNLAPRAPKSAL